MFLIKPSTNLHTFQIEMKSQFKIKKQTSKELENKIFEWIKVMMQNGKYSTFWKYWMKILHNITMEFQKSWKANIIRMKQNQDINNKICTQIKEV